MGRRAFGKMSRRVAGTGEVECHGTAGRSESEPEEGVQSVEADAKPSDLHLPRMKSG